MFAHLFNTRNQRGRFDLYLTTGASLVGAVQHSSWLNLRAAKAYVQSIGAQRYNY